MIHQSSQNIVECKVVLELIDIKLYITQWTAYDLNIFKHEK